MNYRELIQAQKKLHRFLELYTKVIVDNINEITKLMSDTTISLMDDISEISDRKEYKTKMADAVLVRGGGSLSDSAFQGDDQTFRNASTEELEKLKNERNSQMSLAVFKNEMNKLDHVNSKLEETMFEIIGLLSVDDVVGQRMDHVKKSLINITIKLNHYSIVCPSLEEVYVCVDELKEDMKSMFVMEQEKEVYQSIFKSDAISREVSNEFAPANKFTHFISQYYEVLEKQMIEVNSDIQLSLTNAMDKILCIGMTTEEGKKSAEEVLESIYLNTDSDVEEELNSVQLSVDEILEGKSSEDDGKRRLVGHFSKHMESLSTLDSDLQDILMKSIGVLSSEDVLRQMFAKIIQSMTLVKKNLKSLDVTRIDSEYIDEFIQAINKRIYDSYVTEEQKEIHDKYLKNYAS